MVILVQLVRSKATLSMQAFLNHARFHYMTIYTDLDPFCTCRHAWVPYTCLCSSSFSVFANRPQFRVEIAVEETIEENIKVLAGVIDNAYPCRLL